MTLSVVILSFNCQATIGETIRSALAVSSDIHVVDSFSSDTTRAVAQSLGARVVTHEFVNYAAQRNWAIEHLPLSGDWELHLDADERLSVELSIALRRAMIEDRRDLAGYHVARMVRFMGRAIRHGGMYPIWHMRCFPRGAGRCEAREYDQHFVVSGRTARLPGFLLDDMRSPLSEWIERHNRWSDAEMREQGSDRSARLLVEPNLLGNLLERKRALRQLYVRSPLFARAFLLFVYRYILRLGFLDGKEGLIFFVLQTFWYHFLIDAKLHEERMKADGLGEEHDRIALSSRLPGRDLGA